MQHWFIRWVGGRLVQYRWFSFHCWVRYLAWVQVFHLSEVLLCLQQEKKGSVSSAALQLGVSDASRERLFPQSVMDSVWSIACYIQITAQTWFAHSMFVDHRNFSYASLNWVSHATCLSNLLSSGSHWETVTGAEGCLGLGQGLKRQNLDCCEACQLLSAMEHRAPSAAAWICGIQEKAAFSISSPGLPAFGTLIVQYFLSQKCRSSRLHASMEDVSGSTL